MSEFLPEVLVSKMVYGGQGLGELPGGRKVFVWNALPGEKVRVQLIKNKPSYAEAVAAEILLSSADRVMPHESDFLMTSPWQMMSWEAENRYKLDITKEVLRQQKVDILDIIGTTHNDQITEYRNKMEYSFWGDESGLRLALHQRGSHRKQIVRGSALAMPVLDDAANSICVLLEKMNVRASNLKTIIVRCAQNGDVAASLFIKSTNFLRLELPSTIKGLRVYYSDPKSPASLPTKLLYELGDCLLEDELLGSGFTYDVDSFFQVNVPVFETTLFRIRQLLQPNELVDMYAGVGSIGLSVALKRVNLIEVDRASVKMARLNADKSHLQVLVVEASSEKSLDHITSDRPVIFDPPRAGLHNRLVTRLLEVRPPEIGYLSCNPVTQARDLALLQRVYRIVYFEVFNFFPRTPHIETLAVLHRRD